MRMLLVLALSLAAVSSAAAQSNPQAEELFHIGRKAMEAKHYGEACDAFAGSQRLEPSLSTLMNLADCREKNGQLASAWGLFLEAATQSRDDARQTALHDVATQRSKALEGRLSRLTISVPATSMVPGLEVKRDGVVVDPATWNRALPIDGGTYHVSAGAPGVKAWTAEITVAPEGDTQSVDVPRFEPLPAGHGPDLPAEGTGTVRHRRRPLALALGGVALVAGGAAVLFELQGRSALDDAKAATTQAEQDDRYDTANGKHHLAQGLAIGAGACAAAAVVVWLTGKTHDAPPRTAVAPVVDGSRVGVAFAGVF